MGSSIIVLEGVDGAGKTTLANKIKDKNPDLNYEIVHCTRHTKNNLTHFTNLLKEYFSSGKNVIFDRFCYGQWIYQTSVDRDKNGWLCLSDLQVLESIMNTLGVKVLYVYSDIDTCLHNCLKDSDDSYYTKEYLTRLDNNYKYFFKNISSMDVDFVYNDYKPEEIKKVISEVSSDERTKLIKSFDYSSLPEVIAVDFDGVLATDCFPNIEKAVPNKELIEYLKQKQNNGAKIILWTCRSDGALVDACNFLADQDFYPDAINENIKEVKDSLLGGPKKVWATKYIDDKAEKLVF